MSLGKTKNFVTSYDISSGGNKDFNGSDEILEVNSDDLGSVQVVGTAVAGAANGVLKLQGSNDGTNWEDLSDEQGNSLEVTVPNGGSQQLIHIWKVTTQKIKAFWTKNGATGGTLSLHSHIKKVS